VSHDIEITAAPANQPKVRRNSLIARWPLRVVASVLVLLLWAQPLLIGLFLGGDFDKLAAHGTTGGILVGITLIQLIAAIPAWRPGGLPGWSVAVCAAMAVGAVVQVAAGFQRNLGLHVPLGVTLAAAGITVAVRAWWPTRPVLPGSSEPT